MQVRRARCDQGETAQCVLLFFFFFVCGDLHRVVGDARECVCRTRSVPFRAALSRPLWPPFSPTSPQSYALPCPTPRVLLYPRLLVSPSSGRFFLPLLCVRTYL